MSLPATAIGLQVFSTVAGAMSAINQGKAEANAANRAAEIAQRNKILANQDRIAAEQANQADLEDQQREHQRQLSSIRANFGSSGLEFSGSPLDILADTSTELALDERRTVYAGQQENRGYALKMLGFDEEASAAFAQAKNSKRAGYINAEASLLGGASKAIGMYNTAYPSSGGKK